MIELASRHRIAALLLMRVASMKTLLLGSDYRM